MEILNDFPVLILGLFFIASFLYASVGHGGASGYLALMALVGIAPYMMRSSALMLNLIVSGISFYMFWKSGFFRWKIFWPFAVASIPASFLGALVTVDSLYYKKILGVVLIFPILRLLGIFGKDIQEKERKEVSFLLAFFFGALIGVLSGMIGIGGGIILSPVLLVFNWANIKESAAISALFIFLNSLSGFTGLMYKGVDLPYHVWGWILAVIAGGFLGAFYGSKKVNNVKLKYILAAVLLIACTKLIIV